MSELEQEETETEATPAPPDEEEEEAVEQEEAQPEPEPEPEPAGDEDRAKMAAKIDRSFKTYQAAVERNIGDEVTDWLLCPLCAAGMAPGFVNRHDLGRIPDEVQANVQTFLGFAREKDYPASDTHSTCTICHGLGKVSTGSRVPEHANITCHVCRGYGYTPPPARHGEPLAANGAVSVTPAETSGDFEQPDRDMWGEPRILPDGTLNENYMKMPQGKTPHPVYGITANLSAEELISG